MMKDKELLESVLNHSKEENIHKYTEPTLKVFETV